MSVYCITGDLGSGKSLSAVKIARDYLMAGRLVATNLDLKLEKLVPYPRKRDVVRLADFPSAESLHALGVGYPRYKESMFGAIILDEAATFLNSREWSDKGRQDVIKWLLHTRKMRWDVYLIIQDIGLLDKQIRTALVEHLVICSRSDRIGVPIIGHIFKFMGAALKLPKFHICAVKYGTALHSPVVDRWVFRGKDLYDAYDTGQKLMGHVEGPSCMLDTSNAPWMLRPVGWYETLYALSVELRSRWGFLAHAIPALPPSEALLRHVDFNISQEREHDPEPVSGKPVLSSANFREWLSGACSTPEVSPGGVHPVLTTEDAPGLELQQAA